VFSDGEVAIDGSKFKAVINRDKNFIDRKLTARIEQLEESIFRYIEELDRADWQPALVPKIRIQHVQEKIASLKSRIEGLHKLDQHLVVKTLLHARIPAYIPVPVPSLRSRPFALPL
jgi:hypothetical protein